MLEKDEVAYKFGSIFLGKGHGGFNSVDCERSSFLVDKIERWHMIILRGYVGFIFV